MNFISYLMSNCNNILVFYVLLSNKKSWAQASSKKKRQNVARKEIKRKKYFL